MGTYPMTVFYKLLITIVILGIFGCDGPSEKVDKAPLVVGLSAEYPPFEFQQKGEIVGFDVDLAHAIGQRLNRPIQIKEMAFHSLIPSLQTGKIDMAISGITVTPERQKNIDFSEVYYHNSLAFIYLKNSPPPDLTQLSHKKFGVQLGSSMEKWLKQQSADFEQVQIFALDTNPALIEKLKLGQIDYLVIETLQAIEFSKINAKLAYQTIGTIDDGYAIALAKHSPLLTSINQALQQLNQQGVLAQLKQKWIGNEHAKG